MLVIARAHSPANSPAVGRDFAESFVEIVRDPKIVESYLGGMADMRYYLFMDSQKRRNRCR